MAAAWMHNEQHAVKNSPQAEMNDSTLLVLFGCNLPDVSFPDIDTEY